MSRVNMRTRFKEWKARRTLREIEARREPAEGEANKAFREHTDSIIKTVLAADLRAFTIPDIAALLGLAVQIADDELGSSYDAMPLVRKAHRALKRLRDAQYPEAVS